MANPTTFTWVDPTHNVDGSTVSAGEITGYQVGIRPSAGTAGTYPTLVEAAGATATSAAVPTLPPGTYAAAVQSIGPTDSSWSAEIDFTIVPGTPQPPSGFSIA